MDNSTKLQNKIDKWENKAEKYKATVSRTEMKAQAFHDKQDKPMKTHTLSDD